MCNTESINGLSLSIRRKARSLGGASAAAGRGWRRHGADGAFGAAKEPDNHDKISQGVIFTPKHAATNLGKVS